MEIAMNLTHRIFSLLETLSKLKETEGVTEEALFRRAIGATASDILEDASKPKDTAPRERNKSGRKKKPCGCKDKK